MKTTLKRGTGRGSANGSNDHATVPPLSPLTPIARYGAPRRRSWPRRIGKALLWLVVVVLMLAGALVGGFWLWINDSVSAVRAHTPEAIEAQKALDVPLPGQPAVAMVVGYDKRPGEGKNKSRSDTIMLIRLDPQGKAVSMLSFPRDLYVEIPPCRGHLAFTGRINEAFTECGQRGSLETVKQLTGIKINYLITVNFGGFVEIVDKLGGVYIDIDQRYFNDNEGLYGLSRFAAIDLHPGYQRLSGRNALDFVRYRHTDSDLYRNARQQEFVKAVKQQVSSFTSITKIPSIVGSITENVEVGAGGGKAIDKQTLYGYAKLAYELPTGSFQQARLRGLTETGTYELLASDEVIQTAVDDFMRPDTEAAEKATQVATRKKAKKEKPLGPPPADVSIRVLNGNGTAGSADDAAYLLGRRGYGVTVGGNADRFDYFDTVVTYDPSNPDAKLAAEAVAKLFDGETEEAAPDSTTPEMLLVTVGQTFHGTLAPAPRDTTPTYTPPDVEPDPEARPLVRRANRKSDFPLLVPTVREKGSSLSSDEPIRVYELGGDHTAVRLTYRSPDGTDYWGIQQTSWTDAPILDGASVTRRIGGRDYRLFFSGSRLHVVAFEENGGAYWVVNTLLDGLSNETMLEIAKGLKPASG
ncbi:MAG: LCP family protein [Gaiellaceae bacterium]